MQSVFAQVEAAFRDLENPEFSRLPPPIFYSLRLHQINAFGYRPEWAESLLPFVRFTMEDLPYFPVSPETPEAHRHKFLCALTLSEDSPQAWTLGELSYSSEDFVDPILDLPVKAWGDSSLVPEPSWTLQFLSAHLDSAGRWRGKDTALLTVFQDVWGIYGRDFANGDLWHPGKTPFTETGLHFLEAMNKIFLRQNRTSHSLFENFKAHVWSRLQKTLGETAVLLDHPRWPEEEFRDRLLEIAITQLLVLGHLLEICFHPKGALLPSWTEAETESLRQAAKNLSDLMQFFFDPRVLNLMTEEQKRAYPFPLLHAYHALVFGAAAGKVS